MIAHEIKVIRDVSHKTQKPYSRLLINWYEDGEQVYTFSTFLNAEQSFIVTMMLAKELGLDIEQKGGYKPQ